MNNNIFSEHYSFLFFCGEEFYLIGLLSRETNDYAAQQLADVRRKVLKSDRWWRPLVVNEMKMYFALYILMRRVKKSSVRLYWTNQQLQILQTTLPL